MASLSPQYTCFTRTSGTSITHKYNTKSLLAQFIVGFCKQISNVFDRKLSDRKLCDRITAAVNTTHCFCVSKQISQQSARNPHSQRQQQQHRGNNSKPRQAPPSRSANAIPPRAPPTKTTSTAATGQQQQTATGTTQSQRKRDPARATPTTTTTTAVTGQQQTTISTTDSLLSLGNALVEG